MNQCIVNEDHPQCNVPRKAIKVCPGRGRALSWALSSPLALSHLESGYPVPFSPQDFCSPCVFVYCCHNTGSCWPGSVSKEDILKWLKVFQSNMERVWNLKIGQSHPHKRKGEQTKLTTFLRSVRELPQSRLPPRPNCTNRQVDKEKHSLLGTEASSGS